MKLYDIFDLMCEHYTKYDDGLELVEERESLNYLLSELENSDLNQLIKDRIEVLDNQIFKSHIEDDNFKYSDDDFDDFNYGD